MEQIRQRRALAVTPPRARGSRRLPRQVPPKAIALEYYKAILEVIAIDRRMVNEYLIPALPRLLEEAKRERGDSRRRTDGAREIAALIKQIAKAAAGSISDGQLDALAEKFGDRTQRHNKEQLNRQVKAALGIDIYKADPSLKPKIADFAAENVALIRNVSADYYSKIETITVRAARTGIRHEELAKQLAERFEFSERRAALIARDQIGKLYGEINQARQTDLGVDSFIWRTSQDNRVRDEHAEREGVSFLWSGELDPDDLPGQPVLCRCYAEPDFSGILASLK